MSKILIVHRREELSQYLARQLEKMGHKICPFTQNSSVLDIVNQGRVDLILLEAELPAKNGLSILKALQAGEFSKEIPIIMLCTQVDHEQIERFFTNGAKDYLLEDLQPLELYSRIKIALDTRLHIKESRQQKYALQNINHQLQREIQDRILAEGTLQSTLSGLESQVEQRTIELKRLIQKLEDEIFARERAEKYLDNVINSMPSILVGVDQDGKITHWNQEAVQVTGVTGNEAQGESLCQLFPQLSPELPRIMLAIQQGRTLKVERFITYEDKQIKFSDIIVYPLVDKAVQGAVVRIDDITHRVHLEEAVVQSDKMLSVGSLAAGMAHEINNPLSGILQSAQNILRRLSPDLIRNHQVARDCGINMEQVICYIETRKIASFVRHIQDSGQRAAHIMRNMLQFSRSSDSKMAQEDLNELIERSLKLASSDYDLKKKYDFKHVNIIRNYATPSPQVPCVAIEIEQVFLNLFKNSAHAIHEMTPLTQAEITICTKQQGDSAVIEITDNGPGMEESVSKRIFEPFFTTKGIGMGTGLGLSVTYFIITNNHRGKITVESALNQGTKITIRLPLKQERY